MTDKKVFEKFMSWMKMDIIEEKVLEDGNKVIMYEGTDYGTATGQFTSIGYDQFYSGVIFDKEGNLVKGYMDSHVMHRSNNCKIINGIFEK